VKLLKDLVIKGGGCTTYGEAEAQKLAKDLGFRVPTVDRVLPHTFLGYRDQDEVSWLIIMVFLPGEALETVWPTLSKDT
jgi:hypothetical protein